MFFEEDDDEGYLNPELYHIVSRELYALGSHLESHPFVLRSVPTHTEDGIPIRKLYVSNLPPKTTRTELFGVFTQYGFIKSCWLRIGEKGPNRNPTPTYAFITYSNPADAHKALQAPSHEKTLRGRTLRTYPADSWHQPAQDADGNVLWKPCPQRRGDLNSPADAEYVGAAMESTSSDNGDLQPETSCPEPEIPDGPEDTPETDESYDILDILNRDCLTHILTYVPITDLIRSERVSKRWQGLVHEYLQGIRTFKTSWWSAAPATLTTAVLRRVLQRVGGTLTRLHIDHHWSALNDRTAHTVGKFCPNLEELKVVGMHTKNWNPLIYGCRQLRSLSFVSCNKLTDSSLVHIAKPSSCVESLTVANNTHVTGLFLTGASVLKLTSLAFYNCYSLQGSVLCASVNSMPHLTTLKLDVGPLSMWKLVHLILHKLPLLQELSLSEYTSTDNLTPLNEDFVVAMSTLTELKVLNLFKNIYISNLVLKQIAVTCTKLESLNISSCNARKLFPGISDEGVLAICSSCHALTHLDVSYLAALSDAGLRALGRLPRLRRVVARGNPALSAAPFARALAACHTLEELDLCGCDSVSEELALAARRALSERPRALLLRLGATTAAGAEELATHELLTINVKEDLSNPNLRPDFVDFTFEDSSDDSFEDLYDHEDFDEFFGAGNIFYPHSDEELDDDMDDYNAIYAYDGHGQGIILL